MKLIYKLPLLFIFNILDKLRRDRLYFIEEIMNEEESYLKYK